KTFRVRVFLEVIQRVTAAEHRLKFDVVRGHQHDGPRFQYFQHRACHRDALDGIGAAERFVDHEDAYTAGRALTNEGIDGFDFGEVVALARRDGVQAVD